jgi:hypothetical protein
MELASFASMDFAFCDVDEVDGKTRAYGHVSPKAKDGLLPYFVLKHHPSCVQVRNFFFLPQTSAAIIETRVYYSACMVYDKRII